MLPDMYTVLVVAASLTWMVTVLAAAVGMRNV